MYSLANEAGETVNNICICSILTFYVHWVPRYKYILLHTISLVENKIKNRNLHTQFLSRIQSSQVSLYTLKLDENKHETEQGSPLLSPRSNKGFEKEEN